MVVLKGKKSSNDIIINDKMSDDEVVASDVPPRYLFSLAPHLQAHAGYLNETDDETRAPG